VITHLHPIYVNNIKRAVFNGSLQGFKNALARINIEFENLVKPRFGVGLIGTEIELIYLSSKGFLVGKSDKKHVDPIGVYLSIPDYLFAPDMPFVPPHFTEDEL
jgi:hypothetical protein